MIDWVIGKKVQLNCEKNNDGETEYTSVRYEGTTHGFGEHNLTIVLCKGGALSIRETDNVERIVYFYPEQVKHLRKILATPLKPEVIKKGKRSR
jgi:hypothetical protein